MTSISTKIDEVTGANSQLTNDLKLEQDAHKATKDLLAAANNARTKAEQDLVVANEKLAKMPGTSTNTVTVTPGAATEGVHPDANESWYNTPWNEAIRRKAAAAKAIVAE